MRAPKLFNGLVLAVLLLPTTLAGRPSVLHAAPEPSGRHMASAVPDEAAASRASPDIRVIDEIVHYNIPMEGGDRPAYLPIILRNSP